MSGIETQGTDTSTITQDWLPNYENDLRNSISPEDSKSQAIVNIWTGLSHIANDETVAERVRDFFGTLASSLNSFGLNAINTKGEKIRFPRISSGEISQTVDMPRASRDIPSSPAI